MPHISSRADIVDKEGPPDKIPSLIGITRMFSSPNEKSLNGFPNPVK